jgi:hypothetical protein
MTRVLLAVYIKEYMHHSTLPVMNKQRVYLQLLLSFGLESLTISTTCIISPLDSSCQNLVTWPVTFYLTRASA